MTTSAIKIMLTTDSSEDSPVQVRVSGHENGERIEPIEAVLDDVSGEIVHDLLAYLHPDTPETDEDIYDAAIADGLSDTEAREEITLARLGDPEE